MPLCSSKVPTHYTAVQIQTWLNSAPCCVNNGTCIFFIILINSSFFFNRSPSHTHAQTHTNPTPERLASLPRSSRLGLPPGLPPSYQRSCTQRRMTDYQPAPPGRRHCAALLIATAPVSHHPEGGGVGWGGGLEVEMEVWGGAHIAYCIVAGPDRWTAGLCATHTHTANTWLLSPSPETGAFAKGAETYECWLASIQSFQCLKFKNVNVSWSPSMGPRLALQLFFLHARVRLLDKAATAHLLFLPLLFG